LIGRFPDKFAVNWLWTLVFSECKSLSSIFSFFSFLVISSSLPPCREAVLSDTQRLTVKLTNTFSGRTLKLWLKFWGIFVMFWGFSKSSLMSVLKLVMVLVLQSAHGSFLSSHIDFLVFKLFFSLFPVQCGRLSRVSGNFWARYKCSITLRIASWFSAAFFIFSFGTEIVRACTHDRFGEDDLCDWQDWQISSVVRAGGRRSRAGDVVVVVVGVTSVGLDD